MAAPRLPIVPPRVLFIWSTNLSDTFSIPRTWDSVATMAKRSRVIFISLSFGSMICPRLFDTSAAKVLAISVMPSACFFSKASIWRMLSFAGSGSTKFS